MNVDEFSYRLNDSCGACNIFNVSQRLWRFESSNCFSASPVSYVLVCPPNVHRTLYFYETGTGQASFIEQRVAISKQVAADSMRNLRFHSSSPFSGVSFYRYAPSADTLRSCTLVFSIFAVNREQRKGNWTTGLSLLKTRGNRRNVPLQKRLNRNRCRETAAGQPRNEPRRTFQRLEKEKKETGMKEMKKGTKVIVFYAFSVFVS